MAGDVAFVEGPLQFQLEFADVDPMDAGVQARIEVEYSGRSQSLKWTAALTINPPSRRQSQGGHCIAIRLTIDAGSMRALNAAFNQFGKWW